MEAKTIDLLKTKSFEANGHKYFVSDKISFARFREYQKLEPRLTYGVGFDEMFKQLNKAYSFLNTKDMKPLDAGVIIHNLMNGIKSVEDESREHPALLMAALVINREDEDAGKYDAQTQLEKIEDWRKEGFDILPFFTLALYSIQGFRETFVQYITKAIQDEVKKK